MTNLNIQPKDSGTPTGNWKQATEKEPKKWQILIFKREHAKNCNQ